MTTREELSDAAQRRCDAMREVEQAAAAMKVTYGEFTKARDTYEAAKREAGDATRAHARIEQELIQKERTDQ